MRLPKLDTIIILVFFICIALWMISRCEQKRSDYKQRAFSQAERADSPVKPDSVILAPQPKISPKPIENELENPKPKKDAPQTKTTVTDKTTQSSNTKKNQANLFVTIDGLKLRKEPGLKSESIAQLKLHEEVTFLGKRTDWTQEISLGKEKVTDRWVLIRTKAGKEGWVFGAGVNFYKEKHKGVLE